MNHNVEYQPGDGYLGWLQYRRPAAEEQVRYQDYRHIVAAVQGDAVVRTAVVELAQGLKGITGNDILISKSRAAAPVSLLEPSVPAPRLMRLSARR